MIKNLTIEDFNLQDLKYTNKAIILYKAKWCIHCQNFIPIYTKIENQLKDNNIIFGIVDIDEQRELINRNNNLAYNLYDVESFPTIVLYKNKKFQKKITDRNSETIIKELNKL